jgi:hypothetical protein
MVTEVLTKRHISIGWISLLNTKFSNLPYTPQSADIPNIKLLYQHGPQYAIVSVTPHFTGSIAHSTTSITHTHKSSVLLAGTTLSGTLIVFVKSFAKNLSNWSSVMLPLKLGCYAGSVRWRNRPWHTAKRDIASNNTSRSTTSCVWSWPTKTVGPWYCAHVGSCTQCHHTGILQQL